MAQLNLKKITKNPMETLIQPLDDHNQTHLANVHPPNYQNPIPKNRYHLVIIGAGPGGLVAAAGAAGIGAKVALIERHLMGGDCLNVGCVPSKGIIRSARAWHEVNISQREFGGPFVSGKGDFSKVMEKMRKLRAQLSPVDSVERYQKMGVDVFIGEGSFSGPEIISVSEANLNFRRAIIATGARAAIPDIPGLKESNPLTNETLFWLTQLPKRMVVIGAGPIGCEMSQTFARFGSEVIILEKGHHVLPKEDQDAAEIVQKALIQEGVNLEINASIQSVESHGEEKLIYYEKNGQKQILTCDQILVSAGRLPNVENLNLEKAGIELQKRGIKVNERLQTTNKKVFAIGDVCSKYQFTHTADAQARMVIANSLFWGRGKNKNLVIPWCTYTQPEIAHVGMYENEAKNMGFQVDTFTIPFNDLDRAVLDGEENGFFRIHLRKGSDRILGATLVAHHAGEMIGEIALAITHKIGLGKIGSTILPYPTQGEIYKKAADAWKRRKLTPTVAKIFKLFFGLFK